MEMKKLPRIRSAALHMAVIAVLVTAACLCMIGSAYAESNFVIRDYDIDMQVNEDDTYLITETIDVHFTKRSHGIYREIPYWIRLDRDGQVDAFYGRVRDFEMLSGQKADKEKGDVSYIYKIGDPDEYADTDTTYKLSYVFDMRGDHLKGADEVYYNLVGTGWEAQDIEHTSFTVTFPNPIDMDDVGVKTGDQVDVPFETEGDRVVRCDTDKNVLKGLTIRAVLPEGYFTKQASSTTLLIWILTLLLAAVTGWGFFLWRKYGRDPAIIETEEFYPPEGLSAPEVGYLDTGEISGEQVTSLLLTLADKGYVRITEDPYTADHRKKKKPSYEITKVKAYDGDSEDERIFMDGLFRKGRGSVKMSQLKNHFYKTVDEIRDSIVERYQDRLYDDRADTWAWALRGLGLVGMIALFFVSKALNGSPVIVGNGDFLVYCVLDAIEILLPLIGFYGISAWINKPGKNILKYLLGFIGWALLILTGIGAAVIFDTCMGAQIPAYLIGLGMIFLLFLMAALCERKTDEYAQLLGRIRGYKRFLQVAEKERMEMLAEQDPDYYYRNLAFAFALGVTAVYAKRFKALAAQPPEWFRSPVYAPGEIFDSTAMVDSMNSMMSRVSSSMTSSPSGSGGGGSFSGGGGAGGGGGGSW